MIMEKRILGLAREFKELLKQRHLEAELIIFGSRARGDNQPDSDLDLCVIVKRLDRKTRDVVIDCAWEIGFKAGIVVVPIIFSRSEIKGALARSPIIMSVEREGVRL